MLLQFTPVALLKLKPFYGIVAEPLAQFGAGATFFSHASRRSVLFFTPRGTISPPEIGGHHRGPAGRTHALTSAW